MVGIKEVLSEVSCTSAIRFSYCGATLLVMSNTGKRGQGRTRDLKEIEQISEIDTVHGNRSV